MRRCALTAALLALLQPSAALAADHVRLELVDAGRWPAGLARDVERDLRAGLSRQQIGLRVGVARAASRPSATKDALALVTLDLRGPARVRLSIEIRDAVTQKRVARDVDLSDVPARGRSVAVAVAVEELLRASWAEIALVRARRRRARRETTKPAPAVVRRAVARALRPDVRGSRRGPLRRHRLGARFVIDGFGGGLVQLGGDAVYRVALGRRAMVELGAGARTSLLERATGGDVGASCAVFGLAVDASVLELGRLVVRAGLGAQALIVHAFGKADAGAAAESARTLGTAIVKARLAVRLRLTSHLALEALGGVGGVIAGVALQQDQRTITSLEGVAISGALLLAVTL